MRQSVKREFSPEEHQVWRDIVSIHDKKRGQQVIDLFQEGLNKLGMTEKGIPDLEEINKTLKELTGWQGVFVEGLESGESFYPMLAERKFPIGNFVRDREDLSYTPEPDIIHDLYGHIPFYTDKTYADACHYFAQRACEFIGEPDRFVQFERIFWFTYEFGLIKSREGLRIFGAGIASSVGECEYALSDGPERLPFDVDRVRRQDFRIDEMQKRLFVLESEEQLYNCVDIIAERVKAG